MYTVQEAALKMGISERHLRLLLSKGEVKGKRLGRDWVVLNLTYTRKRRKKEEIKMPKINVTFSISVGIGKNSPRNEYESTLVDLAGSNNLTVGELIHELIATGDMTKSIAEKIVKGAIAAGVLTAFTL